MVNLKRNLQHMTKKDLIRKDSDSNKLLNVRRYIFLKTTIFTDNEKDYIKVKVVADIP